MLHSLTQESQDLSTMFHRAKLQRRGSAKSAVIRILVLLVLFLGIVIFGWFSRPDLVRHYLGIMAPAKNTDQALLFANEDLFAAGQDLANAQVTLGLGGKNILKNMGYSDSDSDFPSKGELMDSPKNFASHIISKIDQARRDVYRAQSLLSSSNPLTSKGKDLIYKNIDFATQIYQSTRELTISKLGKALNDGDVLSKLADIESRLKAIRSEAL